MCASLKLQTSRCVLISFPFLAAVENRENPSVEETDSPSLFSIATGESRATLDYCMFSSMMSS